MSHPPAIHDGVLIVFDGPGRLRWRRSRSAYLAPIALWPDRAEAADVRRRLAAAQPLLVVLHAPSVTVSVFPEQLAAAPASVVALAAEPEAALVDLELPVMDWLPEDLRRRGLRFLRRSMERAALTPSALSAPLVLEEPDPVAPHVRFAHQLRPCSSLERQLPAIVRSAFGPAEVAA